MIDSADVVVIGSGGLGAATAYYLAKRGTHRIALLERLEIGSQTSPRAAGMVNCLRKSDLMIELIKRAVAGIRQFSADTGQPQGGAAACGCRSDSGGHPARTAPRPGRGGTLPRRGPQAQPVSSNDGSRCRNAHWRRHVFQSRSTGCRLRSCCTGKRCSAITEYRSDMHPDRRRRGERRRYHRRAHTRPNRRGCSRCLDATGRRSQRNSRSSGYDSAAIVRHRARARCPSRLADDQNHGCCGVHETL